MTPSPLVDSTGGLFVSGDYLIDMAVPGMVCMNSVRPHRECTITVQIIRVRQGMRALTVVRVRYLDVFKDFFVYGTTHALSRFRCICTESAEQILIGKEQFYEVSDGNYQAFQIGRCP